MRSATSGPRDWGGLVALATALAFVAKLSISYWSFGTVDVAYWQQFAMRSHLGAVLYRASPIFNHPPATLHVLPALGAFVAWSGLPFPFCLRLPGIIADVGSIWLVWRITQRSVPPLARPAAAAGGRARVAHDLWLSRQHRPGDDLLPWAVAAGPLIALVFYAASGVFLYWTYARNLEWNDTTRTRRSRARSPVG